MAKLEEITRGAAVNGILLSTRPARFKRFKDVSAEVRAVFQAKRAGDHAAVDALLKRIEGRRDRRNGFFHSTHLLDLNLHPRDCVEACCDLLDYGKLVFPADWDATVAIAGNMETCEAMIRLDRKRATTTRVSARK